MSTEAPPSKKQKIAIADLLAPRALAPPESDDVAAPALLTADRTWAAAARIQAQMPHSAIPLTILTGFLGAGKSTILNYILRAPHKLKIAVLINEFGAIDIDSKLVDTSAAYKEGDPVILDNGCICCTVSNGFIEAVTRILETASKTGNKPDYIIVETTGLADPKPIVDSIHATELRADVYVDQILTAVDSSAWTATHYDSETAKKQLFLADTVLLTKTDLVPDGAKVNSVIDSIVAIRPNARILRSQSGYVPIHALFDLDIASRAKEVAEEDARKTRENAMGDGEKKVGVENGLVKKDGMHTHGKDEEKHAHEGEGHAHNHAGEKDGTEGEKHTAHGDEGRKEGCNHKHEHEHTKECAHGGCGGTKKKKSHLEEEGFSSVAFTSENPLSLRRFRRDFMDELPDGVFRSKGLLWFNNYESRFIFHWSGSRFNVDEDEWPEGVKPTNQLVIIGRNLDHEHITRMLEGCVVQPGDSESEDSDEEGEEDIMNGMNDDAEQEASLIEQEDGSEEAPDKAAAEDVVGEAEAEVPAVDK